MTMDVKSLIPWNRNKSAPALRFEDDESPFLTLHREVNRLFDDMFRGVDLPMGRFGMMDGWPQLDVTDSGKEISVTAELPGMDEKDVELTLRDGMLTIKGEKKSESKNAQYSERWHGQFQRSLQLGPDVDPEKISATFKNGLLSVTLEKRPEAQNVAKRIPISG
jgi:HSP20 family protein